MVDKSDFTDLSPAGLETGVTEILAEKIQDARDVIKEAREKLFLTREDQAKAFLISIRKFKEESQRKSRSVEKRLSEFRDRKISIPKERQSSYLARIDELDQLNRILIKRLDEYMVTSKGKWISFKYEFNHDMAGLEKSITDFR
jgi:hypothetical protein